MSCGGNAVPTAPNSPATSGVSSDEDVIPPSPASSAVSADEDVPPANRAGHPRQALRRGFKLLKQLRRLHGASPDRKNRARDRANEAINDMEGWLNNAPGRFKKLIRKRVGEIRDELQKLN